MKKKKMKKKKIGFDYIKTLGSLVASRFIALDGPLSHSSVRASDVFGEPNLFCTPAAVPTPAQTKTDTLPSIRCVYRMSRQRRAHATWPFLSASNNDRRQFECHTKRSHRRLLPRARQWKITKNTAVCSFSDCILDAPYMHASPAATISQGICETFKRRKQKKNCEKQILTGRAIEKKNKRNYGREGLFGHHSI